MLNNKHILLLPSWYPAHPKDIRGCFFREQALALTKAGYQVGVITSEFRSLKNWSSIFSSQHGFFYEKDCGINTIRFKTMLWFPRFHFLINKISLWAGLNAFEKYIRKFGKPDIIHVHSCLYMGEVARYIKEKYNISYIVTEHSSGYIRNLYSNYQLGIAKKVLAESSYNIAVSRQMAIFFQEKFNTIKVWQVIPNIVNSNFLNKNITKVQSIDNFRFINVAFMNKNKRQINIIKAAENLEKQGVKGFELVLIGDGEEKTTLEKYVKENGLKNIQFLGLQDRENVSELMSTSDCFVLSSDFETFGVVIIEALACGLPVISTRCGGPEDIIDESNGVLITKNNIEEITAAMEYIIKNYSNLYDKNSIREECEKKYSERAISNALSNIYEKVILE